MNKSINSIENYKQVLKEANDVIISKYLDIISEYINFSVANIHIQKNNYFKYVIIKGIETIQYVFIMLLLYTKNLDLTHHHCSKAFYYYIEFIGQVGDDNHVFLRLTSTDAILFVYKKTIFEINDGFKRTFESPMNEEKEKYDTIKSTIELFNLIIFNTFDKVENVNSAERNNIYLDSSSLLIKSFSKLITVDVSLLFDTIKTIQSFNHTLISNINENEIYINSVIYFIKKIIKKYVSTDDIKNKHIIDFNNQEIIYKCISIMFD